MSISFLSLQIGFQGVVDKLFISSELRSVSISCHELGDYLNFLDKNEIRFSISAVGLEQLALTEWHFIFLQQHL